MERIIDDRCTGKTKKLFLAAKEQNAIIVCSNPRAFSEKASRYGIVGLTFVSYSEFLGGLTPEGCSIMIDELEDFVSHLCTAPPSCNFIGYTISVGE